MNDVYEEKSFKTYVVVIDYSVNEDSIFFSNGISYNVISVVLEGDTWRIGENVQIAEPKKLLEKGYIFSDEYDNTVEMMNAREEGVLVNGDGEEFDTIGDQIEIKVKSTSTASNIITFSSAAVYENQNAHAVNSKMGVPNSSTCIRFAYYDYRSGSMVFQKYIDAEGNYVDYPCFIPYHTYCLGVTAGECRSTLFDGKARKAIVLAIKTYTWYRIIHPRDPERGVHVRKYLTYNEYGNEEIQNDQCYAPNTVSQNKQVTADYNAMKDIWMESALGYIFEASHNAVSYDTYRSKDSAERNYVPTLNQNGCMYLVDKYNYNIYIKY